MHFFQSPAINLILSVKEALLKEAEQKTKDNLWKIFLTSKPNTKEAGNTLKICRRVKNNK